MHKLWAKLKVFFIPLTSAGYTPMLEIHMSDAVKQDFPQLHSLPDSAEDVARRNQEKLEIARLEQERDAINKNLTAQHRLLIATLLAILVALFSSVTAVIISVRTKPVVIVSPTIELKK